MSMPKNELLEEMTSSWSTFVHSMEDSLVKLENDIKEATDMAGVCKGEWCETTEHVIDDLANSLYSISEPRGSSAEDSRKIKELKKRVHDLYANYRTVYKNISK